MNDLAERIIDDLKAFSADLLQTGIDTRGRRTRVRGAGGGASLVHAIDSLTSLVPRLLRELESVEAPTRYVENVTPIPTGATLSRRPADYRVHDGRVMPRRWVKMVPLPESSPRALRWLLYLLDRQRDLLIETQERTEKRVAEALAARRGRSVWAQADESGLRTMVLRLQETRSRLRRAMQSVQRAAGPRPIPTHLAPSPYPPTQAWVTLRRLAPGLIDPQAVLPVHLVGLLDPETAMADLPYLYQRWCGVKIVETLSELGWELRDDPVGAIFLGGLVTFHRRGHSIDLWVEPRLPRKGRHPSGFKCVRGDDVTPDYLFVTPGPGGPDAFVLDATLLTSTQDHVAKGRYLDLIELENLVRIAGCPIKRRPKIAWAAAPIVAYHGKTLRADGAIGTVPMNPLQWHQDPLSEWLADVARHAMAWSLVESAG